MTRIKLIIEGMSCVSCAGAIQSSLESVPGITHAEVHFASSSAVVEYEKDSASLPAIISAVRSAGYDAQLADEIESGLAFDDSAEKKSFTSFLISLAFTFPLIINMFVMLWGIDKEMPALYQALLASVVQFWCGRSFYRAAYYSAKSRRANMDLLVVLGTSAAYLFSMVMMLLGEQYHLYFESSAVIITLILFGRWLEAKTKGRASDAIRQLIRLQPKSAWIERNGEFIKEDVFFLLQGDRFQVKPGESIPVDGLVEEGYSTVDQSMLTGESLPIVKEAGQEVYGGSLNHEGALIIRATAVGKDTTLSRIIQLVDQAQNSRAPIEKLVDSISEIFVPAVLGISLVTFIGWWLVTGIFSTALINAVSVLVIACPCALGLATPTVIMVASGWAASMGILFKEASALQMVEKLQVLFIDKTGTITEGTPLVESIHVEEGVPEPDFLSIACALSANSSHPLSQFIVRYAKEKGIPIRSMQAFSSLPGRGLKGTIEGKEYFIGSVQFAAESGVAFPPELLNDMQKLGASVSLLWSDNKTLGWIYQADRIRSDSKAAIQDLKDFGILPIMVTGDHDAVARKIAKEVGIDEIFSEVFPDQKEGIVRRLKEQAVIVGMVGDGVNDAPALASASVGFAIGSGSDAAIATADITLIRRGLGGVVDAVRVAKRTFSKVRQNLFLAFIYNVLAIPLAAFGLLNPMIAAAAMAMSSVSVITNALLLKKS